MTMKGKLLDTLLVAMLVCAALLIGCAKAPPSPLPTPVPKAPAPAPSPTATPLPKPTPPPAPAKSAADFYKENTVTILVGFKAGGGTDTAARLLTAFWSDVTGGNARIKNMPGGDGILAANEVFNAKPDGLTLGVYTMGSLVSTYLFKDPAVKYDIGKFSYMGLYAQEAESFGISAKLPYKTIDELKKVKGLKLGVSGRKPEMGAALVIHLLGLQDTVVIPGFPSTPEVGLAIARGEVHGVATSMGSLKQEIDKGFVKPMLTLDAKKSPWFPELPTIVEVAPKTPEAQKLLDIYLPMVAGRLLFGPAGIPEDRVKCLSDAVVKIVASEGYKGLSAPYLKFVEPAVPGAEVVNTIKKLKGFSEADIAEYVKIIDKYIRR